MSALKTQIPTNLSTEQAIVNHVSVEVATEISGYNAQYLRRLLRVEKLDGIKVGQVWLINLASLQNYFSCALSTSDLRCGPKGAWQQHHQSQDRPPPVIRKRTARVLQSSLINKMSTCRNTLYNNYEGGVEFAQIKTYEEF